jgi:hypothetical protein
MNTKHVVCFSGGIGSFAAAKRVIDKHGTANTVLLFCDTKMEDGDLYRFLGDSEKSLGIPITRIADGRTPWEVFFDNKIMGSGRADLCSRILKRELMAKWLTENCLPDRTIVYVGIDWTESHRYDDGKGRGVKPKLAQQGWTCEAPMCERPFLTKQQMLEEMEGIGVKPPRAYALGFSHNNCGFFCVKAGNAHFANLLDKLPERYAYHEQKEQEFIEMIGKPASILTDRRGVKPGQPRKLLTLKNLRLRIEAEGKNTVDPHDIGGCGCFVDTEA